MVSKSDKLPDKMKLSPFEGMPDERAEAVCETGLGAKTVPSKTFSLSASWIEIDRTLAMSRVSWMPPIAIVSV